MRMMKYAMYSFAAGAACMQKRMMEMMMNTCECGPESASKASSQSCGSMECCSTTESKEASACATAGAGKPGNLVEAALADPRFGTLATALTAADLVGTLQQEGPFTVFAPTDAAFAKLPEGVLEDLLKPQNKEKLASILTYHVVAGKLLAGEIESTTLQTVNGRQATVKVTAAGTKIDNANVVETDLIAPNGVIHVIDQVILPASEA